MNNRPLIKWPEFVWLALACVGFAVIIGSVARIEEQRAHDRTALINCQQGEAFAR